MIYIHTNHRFIPYKITLAQKLEETVPDPKLLSIERILVDSIFRSIVRPTGPLRRVGTR